MDWDSRSLRCISLDCWGTLLVDDDGFQHAIRRAIRDGIQAISDRDDRSVDLALSEEETIFSTLTNEEPEKAALPRRRYERVLRALDVYPIDEVVETLQNRVDTVIEEYDIKVSSGGIEFVTAASDKGLTLFVCSNLGWTRGKAVSAKLGRIGLAQRFQATIFSDEAGAAKPAPAFFQYFFERAAVSASTTVHVGDTLEEDCLGAGSVGISCWLLQDDDSDALRDADIDNLIGAGSWSRARRALLGLE